MSKTDERNLGYYDHSPHFEQCKIIHGEINLISRVGPYKEAKNFSDLDLTMSHLGIEYQIAGQKYFFGKSKTWTDGCVGGGTSSGPCDFSDSEPMGKFESSKDIEEMKSLPSVFYSVCGFANKNVKDGPPLCLLIDQKTTRLFVKYKNIVLVDMDEIGLGLFKKNTMSISQYRCYWNQCEYYNQPIMLTIGKIDREDFLKHAYIGVKIDGIKIKDVKEAVFIEGDIDYYVISKSTETYNEEKKIEVTSGSEVLQRFTESDSFSQWLVTGDASILPFSTSGESTLVVKGGDPSILGS